LSKLLCQLFAVSTVVSFILTVSELSNNTCQLSFSKLFSQQLTYYFLNSKPLILAVFLRQKIIFIPDFPTFRKCSCNSSTWKIQLRKAYPRDVDYSKINTPTNLQL